MSKVQPGEGDTIVMKDTIDVGVTDKKEDMSLHDTMKMGLLGNLNSQGLSIRKTMRKKFHEIIAQETYSKPYSQKYLQEGYQNSSQFLDDCTYHVFLDDLYTMDSSCAYDGGNFFQPVQVEIEPSIRHLYGGNSFLVQVWDKLGQKAFERAFNERVNLWAICTNYFVWNSKDANDKYSDCFQIIDLTCGDYLNQPILRVKDFTFGTTQYICYNNGLLYAGNKTTVKVVKIDFDLQIGHDELHEVDPETDIGVVDIGEDDIDDQILQILIDDECKKQNKVVLVFATEDDQVSLNYLKINSLHGMSLVDINTNKTKFDFHLIQLQEYIKRPGYNKETYKRDRIIKLRSVIKDGNIYQIVQTESNNCEIYYRGMMKETYKGKVLDIEASPDALMFNTEGQSLSKYDDEVYFIDTVLKNRVNFTNAKLQHNINWHYVHCDKFKDFCKLFSGYILVETCVFISHGNVVTLMKMDGDQFVLGKHIQFDHEIVTIFRKTDPRYPCDTIGVLMQDGQLTSLTNTTPKIAENWQVDTVFKKKLPGDILHQISRDFIQFQFPIFITKDAKINKNDDPEFHICTQNGQDIVDISGDIGNVDKNSQIIGIYEDDYDKTIFCHENQNSISVFQIIQKEECGSILIKQLYTFKIDGDDFDEVYLGGLYDSKYLTLVTMKNCYKFSLTNPNENVITIKDINWQGFLVTADLKYCFSLTHQSHTHAMTSGLKYYDMEYFRQVENGDTYVDKSYILNNSPVGCQAFLDYSYSSQRITYQSDFGTLKIIPSLHLNTISFMGQTNYDDYILTRSIKDKFYALTKDNMLHTWSILTGKKIFSDKQITQDYSDFNVFSNEKDPGYQRYGFYPHMTLISKNKLTCFKDSDFFSPDQLAKTHHNQITYIQSIDKNFHLFKVAQIENNEKVEELLTFVHPVYTKRSQKLYFSDDLKYMCEMRFGKTTILYRKELLNEQICKENGLGEVYKWVQIIRYKEFPRRYGSRNKCDLMTPDFTKYIDMDMNKKCFVIRDSQTNEFMYNVPSYLMKFDYKVQVPDGEDTMTPQWIFNRFTWVNNNVFRVISDEGIEKMVDIAKGKFKQIEFRVLQNFKIQNFKQYSFFTERAPLEINQVLQRLKYKAQNYRSYQIFDECQAEGTSLYESLITVDFLKSYQQKRFISDLSFTYLHWKLIEELDEDRIMAEEITDDIIKLITHNVLPDGNTYMHKLCDQYNSIELFYQKAQNEDEDKEKKGPLAYKIPILENFKGESTFTRAVENQNFRILNLHLHYLQDYQIDHHSRVLIKILPELLENQLSNLIPYLKSRMQQTLQIKNVEKATIQDEVGSSGSVAIQLWDSLENQAKLYYNGPKDKEVTLNYIDVPYVHCLSHELSESYFKSLGESENLAIFELDLIQKQILFVFSLVRKNIVCMILIPYIYYLVVFDIWTQSTFTMQSQDSEDGIASAADISEGLSDRTNLTIILISSIYFLFMEVLQMRVQGIIQYFSSVQTVFDLAPPICVIIYYFKDSDEIAENSDLLKRWGTIFAICQLMVWMKLFLYLRIFTELGFYVKALFEIIVDIRHFIFVIIFFNIAFGDAFRRIASLNEEADNVFVADSTIAGFIYIYTQSLGDFDLNGLGEVSYGIMVLLFILSTFMNCIVILNLLIAIISESFDRINSMGIMASYREKANMIAENYFLIFDFQKRHHCSQDQYLLCMREISLED